MSNESKSPFEKARDRALRALMAQGSLTPEQVSSLKLRQLHLATSTLTVEPDAFAASPEAKQETIHLKLDASLQRALIDWLVVRPDGPNDHLFPGPGQTGLEVATIKQVAAEKESAEPDAAPRARDKTDIRAEKRSDPGAPMGLPEPLPRRPQRPREERPSPPPPPAAQRPKEPEGVPLEEIEALRKRLADAYDAWAPAVTPGQAEPSPKPEAPPPPPIETRPPEPTRDRGLPPERSQVPEITRPEEVSRGVPRPPAPRKEEAPREVPRPSVPRKEEAPREVPRPPMPRKEEAPREVPRPSAPRREEARPSMPRREEAPREVPRPHMPMREEPGTEPEEAVAVPAPSVDVKDTVKGLWKSGARGVTLSYRALTAAGVAFVAVFCCVGLSIAAGALLGRGGLAGLVAVATPASTEAAIESSSTASPTVALFATPTATGTPSPTTVPSPTFTPPPTPTNTPAPTPTPMIVVVTATPTPEPPPTDTPVPTNTPQGGAPAEPTAPPAPAFKYPAPTLLEPKDGGVVPGSINYLKWEPVGPLADDEWYAVRLVFLQQGQPAYEGDRTKEPVWLVPERLYYKADGPALEYNWFVFVERQNPDGSTSQISPESKTNVFRWE